MTRTNQTPPTENSGQEQDRKFKPGQSGNPAGKPRGARNHATRMIEALMEGDAEAIARAVIDKAKEGDMAAARIIMERLAPVRKGRAVQIDLPAIAGLADLASAQAAILAAMACGEITTDEAADAAKVLETVGNAMERRDLEARIAALEGRADG